MSTDAFSVDAWDPALDVAGDPARLAAEVADAERRERERLAEALHDDALQRLLSARQDLVQAGSDPEAVRSVQRQLVELTDSLRTLTKAMHEDALATLPLREALERLADDAARRGRFSVSLEVEEGSSGDHDLFIQNVVRELLANVVKHAGAKRVQITVQSRLDLITVRVSDDGRGTSVEEIERAGRDGHIGHAQLRRRLAAIGGGLDVDSSPLGGTAITVRLPLEQLRVQRAMEDDLRRERRWSAALVAAMQDGFLVFRDGRPVQVNERFCDMTGLTRDALLAGEDRRLPFWADGNPFAEVLDGATGQSGTERRAQLRRADASTFPALISARTISGDGEQGTSTLVTVKDITALEQDAERARQANELEAVVRSTNRLRSLLDAARAVSDEPGLDLLLDEIVKVVCEDLGWVAVMNLYRPETDDFIMATAHGLDADGWTTLAGTTSSWAQWTPLLDARFESRGAFLIPDDEVVDGLVTYVQPGEREPLDHSEAWRPDDMLLIPVRHTDGHFLGVLSLGDPTSGMRPTDAELDVLVAIASHAALAVQHAQEAIEVARHARSVERLLEVSSRIAATREVEPMLEAVAHAIHDALGFERVVVELVDEQGRLAPRAAVGVEPELLGILCTPAGELRAHALASLLDKGFSEQGCFVLDREEAAARMPEARRELLGSRRNGAGWRAWQDHTVLVPLLGPRDELVGVVWVDDPADRLLPTDGPLQVLHTFANQATAALIAADRFERMEHQTDGDPVTRLGNRRAFLRELDRELARAVRTQIPSTLVLVSLEGCEGLEEDAPERLHHTAATVLTELATAFQVDLRRNDRAFRLEGALFGVLLTGGTGAPNTVGVAARLVQRLRRTGTQVQVHFGVASLGPEPEDPADVLRRAGASLTAGVRTAEAQLAAEAPAVR